MFQVCLLRPDGGIGRRAGLKHLWETVPVRLRLRVLKTSEKSGVFYFYIIDDYDIVRSQTYLGSTPAPGT